MPVQILMKLMQKAIIQCIYNEWPVGVRILNRSLPIFIRSSSLCCVARQTCRIIGNGKNNNTVFEKCGTSADFAGPRDI